LTGEWILVSPHRAKRPWAGKTEETSKDGEIQDQVMLENPLAPGSLRNGKHNPMYEVGIL